MRAALLGIAIVGAHLAAFFALAWYASGDDLVVHAYAPLVSPELDIRGSVPASLASRVTETIDGKGTGLRRKRWRVEYRGGFAREVGVTQLVGPFQDPQKPACSGRVVIGQRILDEMTAPTTRLADSSLAGLEVFPIGKYQRVEHLTLQWARLETHLYDAVLLGAESAPHGYIRATATVVFDRAKVPIVAVFVPESDPSRLRFRVNAHADVSFDNRAVQWTADKLGVDGLATRLANNEIENALVTTFQPPPPFDIGDRLQLRFLFCDAPVEIGDRAFGALPFAVQLSNRVSTQTILPPHFAPGPRATPAANTTIAIDLDLDALDALLYELWYFGWLDRQLAKVGLDRRFNSDPIVTEYLSVRLSPIELELPPVVEPGPHGLRLGAAARVTIGNPLDARESTRGRVYGALDLTFGADLKPSVDLGALELACESYVDIWRVTLTPCYSDLVGALADRGAEFHGALTDSFAHLLEAIFVDRSLSTGQLPSEIQIRGVVPSLAPGARGLHLELDAHLVQTR